MVRRPSLDDIPNDKEYLDEIKRSNDITINLKKD